MGGEEKPRAHNQLTKKWIILPLVAAMLAISLLVILLFAACLAEQNSKILVKNCMNSLHGRVTDRAGILLHVNASAFALANALGSTKINSSSEIAPRLFIAFSTIQLVSHASYIGKDGLVISYHRNNRTNPVLSNIKCWKEYFLDALNGEAGNAKIKNQTIFFNAPVKNSGVVSLGVDLKDFLRHVSNNIGLDQSRFFVTMNSSSGGSQIPVSLNDQIIDSLNDTDSSYPLGSNADVTEHLRSTRSSSMQIEIPRVPLVITIASPDDKTTKMVQVLNVIIICLAAVALFCVAVFTFFMLRHLKRSKVQEVVLRADLIKMKAAMQQAERKSMNKSMAFAQASHDVRNALYSIIGLIEICLAEIAPSSELATNLALMNDCAANLLDILNTILDTSKVESGKMQLEQAEFNISEIIEKSVNSFNVLAEKKGLEMIWDPCDFSVLKLAKVIGDKQRFKQILDNLLGNAVKFTSEGKIVVRAWANKPNLKITNISSDYGCSISHMFCCGSKIDQQSIDSIRNDPYSIELNFEVDDTGIGIPVEKRASVFENYVQVKEDSPEGTGLGLGIVQSFVRLMGGEISIKEKDPGEKGTCFKFNIFLGSDEVALHETNRNEETNRSTISEIFTLNESHAGNIVHSLLFIKGSETKRILQTWIESLGMKVWIAQQAEHISPTLEKIKRSINKDSRKGEISESEGCSHIREKATEFLQRGALCSELPLRILIIVDLSNGKVSDILSDLKGFTERNTNLYCKIACIADSKVTVKDLSKFRSLPCDLTLRKPIHGSRLHELFELIQQIEKTEELSVDESQIAKQQVKHSKMIEDISIRIEHEKPLSGKRVLLVDDGEIMRKMGSRLLLDQLGAHVELAKDGLEALDLVKKALEMGSTKGKRGDYSLTYDAIFMDCQMPVMNGYEAAIRIRKEETRYRTHVPLIALSADASEEEVQKALAAGMDLHLEKPLTKSKVIEAFGRVGA